MEPDDHDWIPQDLLWDIGASFVDATVDTAAETIESVIAQVARRLDASITAVWRVNRTSLVTVVDYKWSAAPALDLGTEPIILPDYRVRDAVIAGNGMAIVEVEWALGEEYTAKRGWGGGTAVVAIVDQTETETTVLVVGSAGSTWTDRDLELVRGLSPLLRQFNGRVRAERELQYRLGLEALLVSLSGRLQTAGPSDVDAITRQVLSDVKDTIGAESVVLLEVLDDETIRLPFIVASDSFPTSWPALKIRDVSELPGGGGLTLREFMAESRVLDVGEVAAAMGGTTLIEGLGLQGVERTVAVLPASVTDSSQAVIAVSRLGEAQWLAEEIDALSTVASVIAQTRGRVAAEEASRFRLEVQRALAATARAFLEVDADGAEDAVHDALATMGEQLEAALAFIVKPDVDDAETMVVADAWTRDGGPTVAIGAKFDRHSHRLAPMLMTDETAVFMNNVSDDLDSHLRASDDGKWTIVVAPIQGTATSPSALAFIWPHGDPDNQASLRDLSDATADLIGQLNARLRAQERVAKRLELDAVVSAIADTFLGATSTNAEQVVDVALQSFGSHLDLSGVSVRRVEREALVAELAWTADDWPRPEAGDEVDLPPPARLEALHSGEPVVLDSLGPDLRSASPDDSSIERRPAVVVPIFVGTELKATLNAIRRGAPWEDHELEAFRSFAAMLGELRARVGSERRAVRRLDAQRLLTKCATDLAEAGPDDIDEVLLAVLGQVGEFAGLGSLVSWQCDARGERYVRRYGWASNEVESPVIAEISWGDHAFLDEVRTAGVTSAVQLSEYSPEMRAVAAYAHGDSGQVDRILLATSTSAVAASVRGAGANHLELFCHTIQEVEARIAAERYAEAAFQSAPVGIVLRDQDFRLITCNAAFIDFVGAESLEQLLGTGPEFVYIDEIGDIEWHDDDGDVTGEAAFRGPGGVAVWGQVRTMLVSGGSGEEDFWLTHIENTTERRRAEQLLRFQASHDELTGLANRRQLLDEIRRVAAGPGSVAVLLLDLDRFKLINDSLGHDRGDELLVVIADRVRLAVRPGDLVARLGGDEFAVVLPGPVTVTDAEFVADRLLSLIGEPLTLGNQKIYPTASIGIAIADDQTVVTDLLRRADTAMYRAKSLGRSRHEAFDEKLREEVTARMATEAGLRDALRNNELLVHYQPEVSLHDRRVLGVEALVRWQHPERGLLAAKEFILVAEESGLIGVMGEIVLADACREAASWKGGDSAPILRVNLAASQLQREETVSLVRSVLKETGMPPQRLCLEITESAVMTDVTRSEEILRRLKTLGVQLAIDDFGTGFSSLAYLKRFPVDALKIDQTFVEDLGRGSEDDAFVRSIVSLAEALSLDVIAEGVETEEQADALVKLGCHRAQGYLFARPAPVEELREILARSLR